MTTKNQSDKTLAVALVGGGILLLLLLVVAILNWRSVTRFQTSLDSRLTQIEGRLEQMSGRMNTMTAQNQPIRRGPDPNRVYTINTAGAPVKGPVGAPITIAEFSDFQ